MEFRLSSVTLQKEASHIIHCFIMLRIAKSLPQRLTSRPYSSTFIDYGKANLVTSNDHGVHVSEAWDTVLS